MGEVGLLDQEFGIWAGSGFNEGVFSSGVFVEPGIFMAFLEGGHVGNLICICMGLREPWKPTLPAFYTIRSRQLSHRRFIPGDFQDSA